MTRPALEDVEALFLGPSFLMADPMGPLLDQDEEEALSPSSSLEGEAPASPALSLSLSSPPPSPTPPVHPSLFLGTKAGTDPLALPWLGGDLLTAHMGADDDADDAFAGMDWMSEKIDLSEFDLDSLIGSPDRGPGSPEDLLASLDSCMDLGVDSAASPEEVEVPHPDLQQAASGSEPPSPAFALELGSEVDVLDAVEKMPPSLSVVAVVDHVGVANADSSPDCDSDSGIESVVDSPARLPSPAAGSSRTKPYSRPDPSSSSSSSSPRVKSASGAPKAEKKTKKMEQNKTAATRYRQKKRVEQDQLHEECDALQERNRELAEKAESISREIQYLTDLMEEVRKRRARSKQNVKVE
ncbi:cyclic AMP-dependent transcription factor ATF-4 [Clinocottus analis]|uniref:cyclic AMP-dependent transcription factor ATF-4 n=1 Tax=Clinocottus analis TaxID=304258 RepID=UPI0035BFE50E